MPPCGAGSRCSCKKLPVTTTKPPDAPILSQGTNQATRGSRKRPDPRRGFSDGPGLGAMTRWAAGHDHLTNAALAAWFGARRYVERKRKPRAQGPGLSKEMSMKKHLGIKVP